MATNQDVFFLSADIFEDAKKKEARNSRNNIRIGGYCWRKFSVEPGKRTHVSGVAQPTAVSQCYFHPEVGEERL